MMYTLLPLELVVSGLPWSTGWTLGDDGASVGTYLCDHEFSTGT